MKRVFLDNRNSGNTVPENPLHYFYTRNFWFEKKITTFQIFRFPSLTTRKRLACEKFFFARKTIPITRLSCQRQKFAHLKTRSFPQTIKFMPFLLIFQTLLTKKYCHTEFSDMSDCGRHVKNL